MLNLRQETMDTKNKHIAGFNTYLHNAHVERWGNLCREYGTLRTFKKGEEFISVGEAARYLGLIKEGSVKYTVYTPDGEERVIGLETVGGYAASFPYCLRGLPSIFSVIVNTDSEIWCISIKKIMELSRDSEEVGQAVSQTLEAVFYNIYDRYVDLYALSAKERYEQLIEQCPELFDIFLLQDIASYLNISRQHLNRLKKGTR